MMKVLFRLCLCFCILFSMTTQAFAQSKKYLIAPFQVNGSSEYAYLSEAFPNMITSRLFQSGLYESAENATTQIIKNSSEAKEVLEKNNLDYLVYGSITMLGSSASIDMSGITKDGKKWQKAVESNIDDLIGTVQPISDAITANFFSQAAGASAGVSTVATAPPVLSATGRNSNLVPTGEIFFEPRAKSQVLNYSVTSMDIGNFSGNGNSDIVLADDGRMVYLYAWNSGAMKPLARYQMPSSARIISVRTFEHSGQSLIAVTIYNESQLKAVTTILEYTGKELKQFMPTIPLFVNTMVMPETGKKILIGQGSGSESVYRGNVFEVIINGDKEWEKGATVTHLPRHANVYNFALFPNEEGTGNNVAFLDKSENLIVANHLGDSIYKEDGLFSGGTAYVRVDGEKPVSISEDTLIDFYFIPLRMILLDMDKDKQPEILVNSPITTAGQILKNYRAFTEHEIISYTWDGIALNSRWKTPIIKGAITDFQVADVTNDNVPELLTSIVTTTGILGMGSGRTVITLIELPIQ